MRAIFSILIWIYWALCIIVFFAVTFVVYLVTFPFDKYRKAPNQVLKLLAWLMLRVNPGWDINIKGAHPNKINIPTIVVANHQSFLDLPLLYLLPWTMKWVAKRDLFKIPFLGWIIFITGQIGIDRKHITSAKKLDKLVEPIAQGMPAMIFPEGTRSQNGKLKNFKNGAFKLSKGYGFQILPVVIDGSFEAMPRGNWTISPAQKFTISVLQPVKSNTFDTENELKAHVYALIEQELSAIRSGQ